MQASQLHNRYAFVFYYACQVLLHVPVGLSISRSVVNPDKLITLFFKANVRLCQLKTSPSHTLTYCPTNCQHGGFDMENLLLIKFKHLTFNCLLNISFLFCPHPAASSWCLGCLVAVSIRDAAAMRIYFLAAE